MVRFFSLTWLCCCLSFHSILLSETIPIGPNGKPDVIGVYRLVMKSGSDNFRESAILDVINILKESKTKKIIYEPNISDSKFIDIEVVPDINDFVSESDVIIANRLDEETYKFKDKIFSRDLYREN